MIEVLAYLMAAGAGVGDLSAAPDTIPSLDEVRSWTEDDWNPALASGMVLQATAGMPLAESASWIQLLSVFDRVGPQASMLALEVVATSGEGSAVSISAISDSAIEALSEEDRGPILALLALVTERTDPIRASDLREEFLRNHPQELEVPEITVRQGRWLLTIDDRREEGVTLLQDFIVDNPSHPVAPEARRLVELQRQ